MSTLVKLVNLTDEDFIGTFGGTQFVIPAASAEMVPDGAMRLWMGDPDARDKPRDRIRHDEMERIRTRNGCYGPEDDTLWEQRRPHLEAYTMAGERIWTVMDDPEGLKASAGMPTYTNEELSRMIIQQAEENVRLRERLEQAEVIPVDPLEPATDLTPPADNPNRVQVAASTGNVGTAKAQR